MNNNNGRGREIFYGVIGVATLVVAIIGATFAYFTATASNEGTITGNAATIALDVGVAKVTTADDAKGLIPMSNSMVEAAVSYKGAGEDTTDDGSKVCTDNNGNAVCQIYEITFKNKSKAGIFVDGYVALTNGLGTASDYESQHNATTMRWAQVFKKDNEYTTAGTPDLGTTEDPTFNSLDLKAEEDSEVGSKGKNTQNIITSYETATTDATIDGSTYRIINTNYIRVSDHEFASPDKLNINEDYDRENDITSALVYNQKVNGAEDAETGEEKKYYIVVWLAETGTVQQGESSNFFKGQVKFVSASGGEVSATFQGVSRVPNQNVTP